MSLFHILLTRDRAFTLRDPQKDRMRGKTSGGAFVCIQDRTVVSCSVVISTSKLPLLVSLTSRDSKDVELEATRVDAGPREGGRNIVAASLITPFLPAALVDLLVFLLPRILRMLEEELMSSKDRRCPGLVLLTFSAIDSCRRSSSSRSAS
jgi:hypothetical protein